MRTKIAQRTKKLKDSVEKYAARSFLSSALYLLASIESGAKEEGASGGDVK